MIHRLQLLRNIGQFDSVNSVANIPLARLTVVYSENGRGKTTLAAVLRSLATGDPMPIAERRRLTAQHPPQVVLDCSGGPPPAIFENNAWNRTLTDLVVFDGVFVEERALRPDRSSAPPSKPARAYSRRTGSGAEQEPSNWWRE
jgi:wobble nucleotide-excising tRNase